MGNFSNYLHKKHKKTNYCFAVWCLSNTLITSILAPSCESHYSSFYCRIADAMHTRCGMPSRGVHSPSVCPSVTFVDSVKTIMSSKVFHRRVATPFYSFSTPNVMAIFRRGYPRTNVEPSRGRQKSRFSANIWLSDRIFSNLKQGRRQLFVSGSELLHIRGADPKIFCRAMTGCNTQHYILG